MGKRAGGLLGEARAAKASKEKDESVEQVNAARRIAEMQRATHLSALRQINDLLGNKPTVTPQALTWLQNNMDILEGKVTPAVAGKKAAARTSGDSCRSGVARS